MVARTAQRKRTTKETSIELELNLDGEGRCEISTGVGFYDHMLTSLTRHSGMDLVLKCQGDTHIDDHHTVEDCAIVLGQAIDEALGDKRGIVRFADAMAPLDEALARAVVDLSGRPYPVIELGLECDMVGDMNAQNLPHVLETLAIHARMTMHIDVIRGKNDHHRAEAAFKSLAIALRKAVATVEGDNRVRSTKEHLE